MQTSAKDLQPKQRSLLIDQLATLLADFKDPRTIRIFLESFFTETEQLVFAKRLGILWLLEEGKSYEEIKDELQVSSATISSVANMKQKAALRHALRLISRDQSLETWLAKILPR